MTGSWPCNYLPQQVSWHGCGVTKYPGQISKQHQAVPVLASASKLGSWMHVTEFLHAIVTIAQGRQDAQCSHSLSVRAKQHAGDASALHVGTKPGDCALRLHQPPLAPPTYCFAIRT